jgi:hypothetical protein
MHNLRNFSLKLGKLSCNFSKYFSRPNSDFERIFSMDPSEGQNEFNYFLNKNVQNN